MRRLLILALGLWGCATPPPQPQDIEVSGTYTHVMTELAFPQAQGAFIREFVTRYDPGAFNVSGTYRAIAPYAAIATLYHYPATSDLSPPSPEEVVQHFQQVRDNLTRGNPGAVPRSHTALQARINGFELYGLSASYSVEEFPALGGPVITWVYLFPLDGWYLKYRFTHVAEDEEFLVPLEQEFISLTRWPLPEATGSAP